jgi:hypothetical protein
MDNNLLKFLARLTSLKNNIPKDQLINREYADEFTSILLGLEKYSNENLADFLLTDDKINPKIVSFNMRTGDKKYSSDEYCSRNFLLMKIDGVLSYFTLLLQPTEIKQELGFKIKE